MNRSTDSPSWTAEAAKDALAPGEGRERPGPRPRSAWRRRVTIGASGTALAAGFGAGAFALASGATSSAAPAVAASVTAQQASGGSGSTTPLTPAAMNGGERGDGGFGMRAPGMGGPAVPGLKMGVGLRGTVTAVSSDGSVTLDEAGGTSVTVKTDASTRYEKDRVSAKASDVAVGDIVSVRPTTATAGDASPTAAEIDIALPSMTGTVVSNDGSTIVITDPQGFQRTVHVTGATTYTEAGSTTASSAASAGSVIVASGAVDSNKTDLDASSVEVILPQAFGTVTAVSGTTITIAEPGGASLVVSTDASTSFGSGATTGTLSSVAKGDVIMAQGTKQPDGTFAAKSVEVRPARLGGRGGPGREGFGGPGF